MGSNKRNLIRQTLIGTGILATGFPGHAASLSNESNQKRKEKNPKQRFNMSGYAALWSAIAPLSEKSVANRSNSVDVPDFTNGAWKTNAPVELTLKGGGTTVIKEL